MPKVIRLEESPTNNQSTVFELNQEGEAIGTIAVVTRDHISAASMTSLMMMDYSWLPKGMNIHRTIIQGGILTMQRNEAIQRMQGNWILSIDDDMVFQPDAVKRIVETQREYDLDIVGALCFRRSPPHQPTLYMRENPTSGGYNSLEKWETDVVEVDATGMAFTLIHKRVFEAIAGTPMPSYRERENGKPPSFFRWNNQLGEDLQFCQDAKNAGCRIFVDTSIEIGHMAEMEITKQWFWREVAIRDKDTEVRRTEMNDKMGLPTLTAEEAKELLGWQ